MSAVGSSASRSLATALRRARSLAACSSTRQGGQFLMSPRGRFRMSLDTMHHDVSTSSAICAVVCIGIPNVESKVIMRVRIHLRRRHSVEPLWRLTIALPDLRAELP
jgi:hypothetical protein